MEKARYNTELYSNLRAPLNNVKPSNFWGSHQNSLENFIEEILNSNNLTTAAPEAEPESLDETTQM